MQSNDHLVVVRQVQNLKQQIQIIKVVWDTIGHIFVIFSTLKKWLVHLFYKLVH